MIILAIETSSSVYSVSLLRKSEALAGRLGTAVKTNDPTSGTSTQLMPAIANLLDSTQICRDEIGLIAVSIGPGSFTGLRLGLTVAKTLAFSLDIPLVGVNTFEAIASQVLSTTDEIFVAINAQRRQLFTQTYRVAKEDGKLSAVSKTQIEDRQSWMERLPEHAVVTGEGLKPLHSELDDRGFHVVAEDLWVPNATTIGQLGFALSQEPGFQNQLWSAEPIYFRPSAAEEKRESKAR